MTTTVLSIQINLGNAACVDEYDALQILERVAREINEGTPLVSVIRDENGNTVGTMEVKR